MPDAPPPGTVRRPRSWGRRLAGGLLAAGLFTATLGTVLWTWRVPLLNRILTQQGSLWQVRMERLEWQAGRIHVHGLRVTHVDQTEPVLTAASVSATGDWTALKAGRLGDLQVEAPRLHWRAGLTSSPDNPDQAGQTGPLVAWDSLKLVQGRIDAADPGSFSFTGGLSGAGGAGAWDRQGRLFLSPQELVLTDPVYAMNLHDGPLGSIEVKARRLDLKGSLEAASGTLAISSAAFAGSEVRLSGPAPAGPAASPPPLPGAPVRSSPAVVSGVRILALKAPALAVKAALPWVLAAEADLDLIRLQAGPEVRFGFEGLRLGQASAGLPYGARLPQFSLSMGLPEGVPRLHALSFSGADFPDAAALLPLFGIGVPEQLTASFKADGELHDLSLEEGRPRSVTPQTLTVRDLSLGLPDLGTISAAHLALKAIPDEVLSSRRLRHMELKAPQADLIIKAALPGPSGPSATTLAAPPAARPVWEGWTTDELIVSDGTLKATLPDAGGAQVSTAWTVRTTPATEGSAAPHYQVDLTGPQLVHPDFQDQPVVLATGLRLTASTAGLWQHREIESLTLAGSRIQIGDALFRMVNALPQSPPAAELAAEPAAPAVPLLKSPPWRLRHLELNDSLIQIDNLGGHSRLDVPVKRQVFRDLPLDRAALAAVDQVYKIEVPNVTLFSPFSAGQKVAVLDTNYIQFTPSGLLERRLERVDLMSPSLYAGQPLFDFVDAARRRFAQLAAAPASKPPPLLVESTTRSSTMLSALAAVTPSLNPSASAAGWAIPFYTSSGKVYVAPKGFPWPNLPVIPFRNARDAQGNPVPFLLHGESFHGELAIEPGWYDFPEYKVRLRLSDRGRIIFNTPQRERDNNLTEVFENNTLIFRQLTIDAAWLAVTYDARGIYARFGGRTCGGNLTGGVNLYLDELYTWDAWASLTSISMKPLTDKLTPDTFRMTGQVDELTLKAYGDTTTLYQAALDLKVTRPGLLHILALDAMKDRIDALGGLSADLGKISLATLRDFAYTSCTGGLKLFGTEGDGQLCLTGPAGSRTFNLRLHDYRAKPPKTAAPF